MTNFDVAVVGGGMIGCTIACEVRKGGFSVAVIDRGRAGEEASKAAAGILAPQAGPKGRTPVLQLLIESLCRLPPPAHFHPAAGTAKTARFGTLSNRRYQRRKQNLSRNTRGKSHWESEPTGSQESN